MNLRQTIYKTRKKLRIRSKFWRRTAYALTAVLFVAGTLIFDPMGRFIKPRGNYELSEKALHLIGSVRDDVPDYLKLNSDGTAYEFMVPDAQDGNLEHTGRVADAFSASFSLDPEGGISVTDKSTQVPVKIVPDFHLSEGKQLESGHIIYPSGKRQLVYSLKYNGLKEDIVLPEYEKDALDFAFDLILPVGVEARLEEGGDIGIYAADEALFGNISYGSDSDRDLIERARESSEKNNRIMTIPSPVIKDSTSKEYTDRSVFKLGNKEQRKEKPSDNIPEEIRDKVQAKNSYNVYKLTISSTRLQELTYPITIDPTFQVTSASDFGAVNLGGGVEIDNSNNLIRRGSMTGGTVTGWQSTMNIPVATLGGPTVVHNGFIYVLGGNSTGFVSTVRYATINVATGAISSWSTTTPLTTARDYHGAAVYNGYIYVAGGRQNSPAYLDTVEYAKINANGTLGSWTSTASLTTARRQNSLTAYGGYLYTFGALTSGGASNNYSQYARLNANGSIANDSGCGSSWCDTTALLNNRNNLSVNAYNGWMYLVGGSSGAGPVNEVRRARINGDGTLGSWIIEANLSVQRFGHGLEIWNGYIYTTGGCTTIGGDLVCNGGHLNTVEYAQINADGSIGTWLTTDSFDNPARLVHGSAVYNGYLYVIGGCTNTGDCGYTDDTQYTAISSAGSLHDGSWATTTNFTTARRWHNVHVYNGYMYVIGGRSWHPTMQNTIQYAAINTNGTIGSWTVSGNTFSTGLMYHATVIYNGYIYISGGQTSTSSTDRIDTVEFAPINSDGSVGAWSATTSLPRATTEHSMFAWDNYLYIAGGVPSVSTDNIERATINSDGTISGWSNVGSLPNQMINMNILLHDGYLYIVGGCNQPSCPGGGGNPSWYQTAVRYAPMNSDGTVGNWTTTSSFTNGREDESTFIYNGYLYIVGGVTLTSGTARDDVQLAPINSDGSLGGFSYTTSLPETYTSSGIVAWGGYMYIVGGQAGVSGTTNAISYQPINNGGQGGPEAFTAGTTLGFGQNRKHHASVTYNGYLYVLGGCTSSTVCTTATTNIRYAPLNDNGSIGTWASTTTTFSTARYGLYAFAYANRMYIAGGLNTSSSWLSDIQYATIQSNGNINTSWTTDDNTVSHGNGPALARNGGYVYAFGGEDTPTDTVVATINTSTGDIHSATSLTPLPEGRSLSRALIYRGYVYIIGGHDGVNFQRSVWYAPLNNDGTIGNWRRSSSELNSAVITTSLNAGFARDGYIYISGGENASGAYNRIQYAAVGAGGDLGAWQLGVQSGLTAHANYSTAEWNGNVYITGGQVTGTNPTNATRYATLQTVPRVGQFNRVYDFESGVRPEKLIIRGVKQPGATLRGVGFYSVNCGAADWTPGATEEDMGLGSANMTSFNWSPGTTLIRCLQSGYQFNDTYGAVFPDAGNESYITDFDVYFISNPGNRLRGGRTFTNGTDRGLQANPQ